jgi:hypothetical protein
VGRSFSLNSFDHVQSLRCQPSVFVHSVLHRKEGGGNEPKDDSINIWREVETGRPWFENFLECGAPISFPSTEVLRLVWYAFSECSSIQRVDIFRHNNDSTP